MRLFQVRLTRARVALLAGMILLSIVGAAAITFRMPPTYAAKSEALLIGPSQVGGKPTNPYLQFSQSLSVTLDVLIVASSDSVTGNQIVARGGTDSYTVVRSHGVSESEPIITVTGSASTPAQAMKTANLVVAFITADLQKRQAAADITSDNLLKLVAITTPSGASRVWKGPVEVGFGVFVLGLVGSLILFVLLDRYLIRRDVKRIVQRRPRRRRAGEPVARSSEAAAAIRRRDKGRIEVIAQESVDNGDQPEESGSRKRRVGIRAMRGRAADTPDVTHEDGHLEITASGSENGDQSEESGSRKRRVGIRAMRGRGTGAPSASPESDQADAAGQDSAADRADVSPGNGPQAGSDESSWVKSDEERPAKPGEERSARSGEGRSATSGEESAAKSGEASPAAADNGARPSESVPRRRRAGMRAIHGPVSGPGSRPPGANRVEISARARSNDEAHRPSENGHQAEDETDSARTVGDAHASQGRPPN